MKICKHCQKHMEDDACFCPGCGESAADAELLEETVLEETVEETAEQTPAEEAAEEETPAGEPEKVPAAEIREGIKATPGKIALAVTVVVLLMAALVTIIVLGLTGDSAQNTAQPGETVGIEIMDPVTTPTETQVPATTPADGNPDDVTCKGTYTVSDEETLAARDVVVATIDGHELTNGELQVYYWMEVQGFLNNYGAYAAYFGLDYTQPLDTQMSMEETPMTWQQYFLDAALRNWHQIKAMGIEAENAGLPIAEEDQATLDGLLASLEESAVYYGITVDELLLYNVGAGAGFDEFLAYHTAYYTGLPYYESETAKLVPTEQELEAYFAANEADFTAQGIDKEALLVDVRHILLMPEGGSVDENGTTTYSDEEWTACETEAQAILDQWLAGEKTEDSFAALANEKSADGGSNTNGGLYENVYVGQMVEPFENWCFDESRQAGDYGLVKTSFGYHIMYFVGSHHQWKDAAESGWVSEKTGELLDALYAAHPLTVDFSKIVLGYVPLG